MAGGGGGMANYIGSGPILTNVTLSGNRAAVAGGLNGAGQASGPSNRTGRFPFTLTPGSP
jgi:hypothetical protein